MSRPRPLVPVLLLAAAAMVGCRRDAQPVDEVQMTAYGVKPAVVRINAYATAEFRYDGHAIGDVETLLHHDGYDIAAQNAPASETAVDTGSGGSGSGFIIHPDGYILTSDHVVAATANRDALARELARNGAIAALVKHFPVAELRRIHRGEGLDRYIAALAAVGRVANVKVVDDAELSNGEKLPFRIERFSPPLNQGGTDVALIRIARKDLPSLRLGDSDTTRVGESIWSVGYPAVASSSDDVIGGWLSRDSDLEATFNPGTITAIKRDKADTPVFQSNVAIYRGNSGGPAVNRAGEVIGISTWGHTEAEAIKFLVPINVAKQTLASAKVAYNVDGNFNRYYRAALDAASDGNWPLARAELASASKLFPNSPDLIRFGRDADRAVAALPLWRQHPVATASVAGGTTVLLAVGAGVFLSTRRRKPKVELPPQTAPERVVAPDGTDADTLTQRLGRFTILNGSHAGERLGLGGSGIRIGRESAFCEIVLENPKVSRLHAEVVQIDGRVLLIDRNSSNGTYVNDQKIDKRFLKDGDIIYFGGRNAVAVAFHV